MRVPSSLPFLAVLLGVHGIMMPPPLAADGDREDVGFDQAIALADRAPRPEGFRRALEARRQGDQDMGGDTQAFVAQVQPGVQLLEDQSLAFYGQVALQQSWSLGGITAARSGAAGAERAAIGAHARAEALLSRLEAAQRWIALWTTERLVEAQSREVELANQFIETTRRGVRGGALTAIDLAEAEAYAAEASEHALSLEGDQITASLGLALAMGRPASIAMRATGDLPHPSLPNASLQRAFLNHVSELPQVALLRLSAIAERAREVEQSAWYGPVISVGLGGQSQAPFGVVVNGTLGLSFNPVDLSQRSRSVLRGEEAQFEGESGEAALRAQRDLADAIHEVVHRGQHEVVLSEQLVPALERVLAQREAAMRAGEGTALPVAEARRRLLEGTLRRIQATSARTWAEVQLWLFLAEIEQGRGSG